MNDETNPWPGIIGPCFSTDSIAREMGVSVNHVEQMDRNLRLLGLTTSDGVRLYPAFQLAGNQPISGLEHVLRVLRRGLNSPLMWAQWLVTPRTGIETNLITRRIDELRAGHLTAVLRAAKNTAAAWSESAAPCFTAADRPDPNIVARRIGDAMRDARTVLARLRHVPQDEREQNYYVHASTALEAVLDELLAAIEAATPTNAERTGAVLTDTQITFLRAAGIPDEFLGDAARRDAEDWLTWSAVRSAHTIRHLRRLEELTALDIVPGLRDVLDALPPDGDDLQRFNVLRTPFEQLDGASPLHWLLVGGDPATVITAVEHLGWLP